MPVLIPVGVALAALLGLWILLVILKAVWAGMRKMSAEADLGASIPRGFRVKYAKVARDVGAFILVYPRWRMAKQDGTRDLRYRGNDVVKGFSVLELGRWRIVSRSVIRLYDFVITLRENGHTIALSSEETDKLDQLNSQAHRLWGRTVGGGLYHRFSGDPTQFEYFCAELYSSLGYRVEITPAVADGGFDLRMFRGGEKTLVECKCFGPSNPVGRPILQKLYGANAVEGASYLILVTTATFTKDAIAYAQQVGIELVDGSALAALCNRAWGGRPSVQQATPREAQLSHEDHLSHIPADMRGFRASFL